MTIKETPSSCPGKRETLVVRNFLLCFFFLVHSASAAQEADVVAAVAAAAFDNDSDRNCGIWIAPSTIPGAGIGLFAGRNYKQNAILSQDLVVPLVDLPIQHDLSSQSSSRLFPKVFLWDSYSWHGENCLMNNEGYQETDCVSPGFGAVPNCMFPLINVEEYAPIQDNTGLHRSRDPGVGAFTDYVARTATAKYDLHAGEELFVDYGASWFETRTDYASVPLHDNDVTQATRLFRKYSILKQKMAHHYQHDATIDSAAIMEELWNAFIRQNDFPTSRVFGSFDHQDKDEIKKLDELKGALIILRRQQATRALEWLEENGRCADNIKPATSVLPQAGRGAFATRDLRRGAVVAPMPLIHIADKKVLDTYPITIDESHKPVIDEKGEKSAQLLLNYCFGHPESTLLLCNYAPFASFVNHNKTLANARIQWGDPKRSNHVPQVLEAPLAELKVQNTAVLAFDLVATRDIKEGEEIYMDYGYAWEAAWLSHVKAWHPVDGAENYQSAIHFNQNENLLKTVYDDYSYPPNVEIHCFEEFLSKEMDWRTTLERKLVNFRPGESLHQTLYGTKEVRAKQQLAVDFTEGSRPVEILAREETTGGEIMYTIRDDEEKRIVGDLPRLAFYFFDKPHTTDMFLTNAFRHEIGIPDDLFPTGWRNVPAKDEKGKDEL